MRIAQIVPSLEARHGGPSRSVRGLSDGLSRCGATVDLLTTGPVEALPNDPAGMLNIETFARRWPDALARSGQLAARLSARDYDVIHSHGLWQRPLCYAHKTATRARIPLVISPRGMMTAWAWNHHRWKKRLAAAFVHPGAFEHATGWHATSESEADDIRRLGFNQPICVAPNGVIPPSSQTEAVERAHWQKLLPALAGKKVALFYSRFHSKKRVMELIDLWLKKPREGWTLLLVGIPEEYSVNQLTSYVAQRGGADAILVRDGAGHPPPYTISSLFLLPSHSENFGLVIAEALVRGVPVLTTDTTPWQELSHQRAGLCVSWENYNQALETLLAQSSAELASAGCHARTWATSTFSWEKAAATLLGFYDRLAVR